MSGFDPDKTDLLSLQEAAARLGLPVTRVRQLLGDNSLISFRSGRGPLIPADFICDGQVVKGLPGTITVLKDAAFSDAQILDWLFTADDTLPGTPIAALQRGHGGEVKRRAQAAGF